MDDLMESQDLRRRSRRRSRLYLVLSIPIPSIIFQATWSVYPPTGPGAGGDPLHIIDIMGLGAWGASICLGIVCLWKLCTHRWIVVRLVSVLIATVMYVGSQAMFMVFVPAIINDFLFKLTGIKWFQEMCFNWRSLFAM